MKFRFNFDEEPFRKGPPLAGKIECGVRYDFGPFHLEPARRRLLRDGQPGSPDAEAFETLSPPAWWRAGHAGQPEGGVGKGSTDVPALLSPAPREDATLAITPRHPQSEKKKTNRRGTQSKRCRKFGYRFRDARARRPPRRAFWLKGPSDIALRRPNSSGLDPDLEVTLDRLRCRAVSDDS